MHDLEVLVGAGKRDGVARGAAEPHRAVDLLQSGEAAARVGHPVELAVLAVADHVEAGVELPLHHLGDGAADARCERLGIVGLAQLLGVATRSAGRGRLPVCVVRIRSVLRSIASNPCGRRRSMGTIASFESAARSNPSHTNGDPALLWIPAWVGMTVEESRPAFQYDKMRLGPLAHSFRGSAVDRRDVLKLASAAAAASMAPRIASAEPAWPSANISIVVPFTPGGLTDILARSVADKIAPTLGRAVIVDNRPGAGGSIGATFVARAAPDGTTLLLGHIGILAVNPKSSR